MEYGIRITALTFATRQISHLFFQVFNLRYLLYESYNCHFGNQK